MQVLFKTQHGSKLYGLDHAESDDDWFVVVAKKDGTTSHTRKRYARQSIIDGVDTTVVDFGTWLIGCEKGVPQFLEAMFAPYPEVDLIKAFRHSYRVETGVYETYLRTIKSFAYGGTYKGKRHALRLALNMQTLREHGRFNARLTPAQIEYITICAHMDEEDVYDLALMLAWY